MALTALSSALVTSRDLSEVLSDNFDVYIAQGNLTDEVVPTVRGATTGADEGSYYEFKTEHFSAMGAMEEKSTKIDWESKTIKVDYEEIDNGYEVKFETALLQVTPTMLANYKSQVRDKEVTILLEPKHSTVEYVIYIEGIVLAQKGKIVGSKDELSTITVSATKEVSDLDDIFRIVELTTS